METSAVISDEKKTKPEITLIVLTITPKVIKVKQTLTRTLKFLTVPMQTIQLFKTTEHLDVSTHPLRPVVNQPIHKEVVLRNKCSQETASLEQTTGRTKSSPTEKYPEQLRWECSRCSPYFKLETPPPYSETACERPEPTKIPKVPPIPEVVW